MKLYNYKKGRKATANEYAKFIILDAIENRIDSLSESFFLQGESEKFIEEVGRHIMKHEDSLKKRFDQYITIE